MLPHSGAAERTKELHDRHSVAPRVLDQPRSLLSGTGHPRRLCAVAVALRRTVRAFFPHGPLGKVSVRIENFPAQKRREDAMEDALRRARVHRLGGVERRRARRSAAKTTVLTETFHDHPERSLPFLL